MGISGHWSSSTAPIAAGLRHKDFKIGVGESFFRPDSLPNPAAMQEWTFNQAALGFGNSEVFLVWQDVEGADNEVTLRENSRALQWKARIFACQFIVGMTKSAPSLMPDGQREVTVLVLV